MPKRPKQHVITKPEQLEAVASPVRQEIFDTLYSVGPSSMLEIAEYLGRPVEGLYYHVKMLLKVGLLVKKKPRTVQGNREEMVVDVAKRPLRMMPDFTKRSLKAVEKYAWALLRVTGRDFLKAFSPGRPRMGPGRRVGISRGKTWLNKEELAEVNRHLAEISAICEQQRETQDRRLFTVTWVLAEVEPRNRKKGRKASS